MSTKAPETIISRHEPAPGSLISYVTGFISSIVLTICAFSLVEIHLHASSKSASNNPLIASIIGLAIVQLLVQLFFFLHLGKETKPRWKLLVFGFMLGTILIIVIGSLWIMANLDYRMTPSQVNNYLQGQDSL